MSRMRMSFVDSRNSVSCGDYAHTRTHTAGETTQQADQRGRQQSMLTLSLVCLFASCCACRVADHLVKDDFLNAALSRSSRAHQQDARPAVIRRQGSADVVLIAGMAVAAVAVIVGGRVLLVRLPTGQT